MDTSLKNNWLIKPNANAGAVAICRFFSFAVCPGAILAADFWLYRRQPQANKRRIAAAPALALGFISQLFFSEVSSLLQSL